MQRPKIAFITPEDPTSRKTWSGTNFFMMQAIQKHIGEVSPIGPLSANPEWTIARIINAAGLRLFKRRYNFRDSFFISRSYARRIESVLNKNQFDLIIAPAGTASLASLKTSIPSVYINDRSIPSGLNYHPILTGLWKFSEESSFACESTAISRSILTIYSSHWAAEEARKAYQENADKIHVIPFGANVDEVIAAIPPKSLPLKTVQLFFAGVKWKEKGGDIAYDTLLELKRKSIPAKLHVAGCNPPEDIARDPDVTVHGFLNKDIPEQFEKLKSLFATADFFILPTRFEAFGLVFCEAASYGLPVIARDTGGISTIVEKNITGMLLGKNAGAHDYAEAIAALVSDTERYASMRRAARKRFEEVLNWDAFALSLKKLLDVTLQDNKLR